MRAISSRRFGSSRSRIVRDLAEVEVEDVLAVVLRRRAEVDVAAHAARARERRIEPVHRDVRGADEVDLLAARPRAWNAERDLADAARHDIRRVEQGVDAVRQDAAHERRAVDAVHHHEQLVQGELAAAHHPAHHPAGELVDDPVDDRVRPARRRALLEQPVAPPPGLDDQVARRVLRAPRAVEREVADVAPRVRIGGGRHLLQRLAAHPDGVDLVDEDDALAAPFAGELLRAPREQAHDDRVDADERRREARAGHRDERRVEAGRERLGEHRLARSRGAEEEQPALALAACALERLAGLPDRDDAPHLLLRLCLPADVLELDAPFGVARLERPHLRQVHDQQRAHQDREVRDEEEEDEDDLDPECGRAEDASRAVPDRSEGAEPRAAAEQPDDRDDQRDGHADAEPEVPEPGAAAAEHVLLAVLLALEAEEARPRDQPTKQQVDQAAERDDDQERDDKRLPERPVVLAHEEDDEGGARQDGDEGGGAGQSAPAGRELTGRVARGEAGRLKRPDRFDARHFRSVRTPNATGCLLPRN